MPLLKTSRRNIEIVISVIGGFTLSFLTFGFLAYNAGMSAMRGQLLAGDPASNRQFPTTLNTMQAAMDGNNPMLSAMGSYGWWMLVILCGIAASFVFLKVIRRFV